MAAAPGTHTFKPMTPESTDRARATTSLTRWGLLATTFALGMAMIAASWANYNSARNARATLFRGQADILASALRRTLRPGGVTEAELDTLLTEQTSAGLRYIALIDRDGSVVASAGTPAPEPITPPPGPDRDMEVLHGRVRVIFMPPPDRRHPDRQRHGFVVEFEPVAAKQLVTRATRSLVLGLVAAAGLMLAALVFWRMSRRYEEAERKLEEQRRLSILGEMSAVLAHEIRNPLASLKGHAQLLAEGLDDASQGRRRADRVVREASRLEALTTDLLDFARRGPLDLEPVDPAALVRTSAEEIGAPAFVLDSDDAPDRWNLDARRFQQVLTNLLRNALQAAPADRPPVVRVAQEGQRLVIEVRDFGPGIAEGDRDRVFDPFYTTHTTGTGLGLPVARRIVELHGGRLHADNAPDGGAVFRIEIPNRPG
ncbi:MAG: HAMP domain-containing sensor histidine kinase [Gemmatimonadota bacterium]